MRNLSIPEGSQPKLEFQESFPNLLLGILKIFPILQRNAGMDRTHDICYHAVRHISEINWQNQAKFPYVCSHAKSGTNNSYFSSLNSSKYLLL